MFSLKSILVLTIFAVVSCEQEFVENRPRWSPPPYNPRPIRITRQVHSSRPLGSGSVFGNLDGLTGSTGYKHDIFDNGRGHLEGSAYGSNTLGDPTRVGGRLDYSRGDAVSGYVDVNRNLRGQPNWQGNLGAEWHLDKNTDLRAQGTYSGHNNYGVGVELEHRFYDKPWN